MTGYAKRLLYACINFSDEQSSKLRVIRGWPSGYRHIEVRYSRESDYIGGEGGGRGHGCKISPFRWRLEESR
jgi:hypothetical protein